MRSDLGLVVLAFTCARFVALGFNRIADRELDGPFVIRDMVRWASIEEATR